MEWRELLLTLPSKLSDNEKRYLNEHSLEDTLLAVPITDDIAQYRDALHAASEQFVLQAIRSTNMTPGAFTTYMRLFTCEFMQTRVPQRSGVVGCLSFLRKFETEFGPRRQYIEPGKPIQWFLTDGGEPVLFYARGTWYSRLGPASGMWIKGQYVYSLYLLDGCQHQYNALVCNDCKRRHIREYPRKKR